MDINDFHGIITVVTMLAFLALWALAWSRHRKSDYDESAQLPLEDDQYVSEDARENS